MAAGIQKIKRTYQSQTQRGTVARDESIYPLSDNDTFVKHVNEGRLAITLSTGEVLPISYVPPAPTPTPDPTPTSNPTAPGNYLRGVIVGNSITSHSASTALNWDKNNGMAASAPEKDNAHIIQAALQAVNSSFRLAIQGQGSGLELGYNSADKDAVTNTLANLNYDLGQQFGTDPIDLIIISIGENTQADGFDETKFRAMLDKLLVSLNKATKFTVVIRNSFWSGNDPANTVLRAYALEKGYKFANLDDIRERADYKASQYQNAGVAHHPNDAGHAAIAGLILDQIKAATTPVTSPGVPVNSDYVAVADQGWNPVTTREKYIENDQIKVGFLWAGAVISFAGLKRDNYRNLVNSCQVFYDDEPSDFRYNKTVDDLGRQWMWFSDYCTPRPGNNSGLNFKNGKSTITGYSPTSGRYVRPGNPWTFNTGNNPVQGGSLFPAMTPSQVIASAVYDHPTRGREFYAKIRAAIWGVKGEPGHIVGEIWVSLKGATVVTYARHTVEEMDPNRFTEQRAFQANEQENPCMYVIAPLAEKLISIPGESRKNIQPTGGAVFSDTYFTDNCRIGAYGDGTGVTYYSPMNSAVKAGQFGGTDGDWTSDHSAYINAAARVNYDNPGVYDDYSFITLGTESEANAAIASLPPIDQSFNFDFSKENMRWWNLDSRMKRESGNNWTWYVDPKTDNGVTSYSGKLMSPFRAWQASGISKVSFDLVVTGITRLRLVWQKPGKDNTNEFSKEFTVVGDGTRRTYTVDTTDANFNGIISSIGMAAVSSATQPGANVIVKNIFKA